MTNEERNKEDTTRAAFIRLKEAFDDFLKCFDPLFEKVLAGAKWMRDILQ